MVPCLISDFIILDVRNNQLLCWSRDTWEHDFNDLLTMKTTMFSFNFRILIFVEALETPSLQMEKRVIKDNEL